MSSGRKDMVQNYCASCTKTIEPDEAYCKKCSASKEREEESLKKRRKDSFFSKVYGIGQWVIVFSLLVLLFLGGPPLYRWISIQTSWGRTSEEVILQVIEPSLHETFGEIITSIQVSGFSGRYSVRVDLSGDVIQLLDLDNVFSNITNHLSTLKREESLTITRVSINVNNINTENQDRRRRGRLVPIRSIYWTSDFVTVPTGSEEYRGFLSIVFGISRRQWETSSILVDDIVERVATSEILEDKIHEILKDIIESPYVESLETRWLWDYYDYRNDLSKLSTEHTTFGRSNLTARDITWAIYIFIKFDSSYMILDDFQEQVIFMNTEIVNRLDGIITPYNLRFRYEINDENASIRIIRWTSPYYSFAPRSHGDLLFFGGGPLNWLNQENLPVDKIQQMIDFSMELSDSAE